MRLTVDKGAGERLDRYLAGRFPKLSRAVVMKYLKEGKARINGRRARPGLRVQSGDDLELPDWEDAIGRIRRGRAAGIPEVARPAPAPPRDIAVVYEDEEIVVVSKPAGLVMHPGEGHEEEGLDRILREHFGPSTRLVHRLDRDTTGLVVAARGHPESARRLARDFKDGDVSKVYLAIVRGRPAPPEGDWDEPLVVQRRANRPVRVGAREEGTGEGLEASTHYRVVEEFAESALVELRPRTGRRHQLRVHLAHHGHPLLVDRTYARVSRLRLRDLRPDLPVTWQNPVILARQPLHAAELTLRHPRTGEEARFAAPLPEDMERTLEVLREPGPGVQ